MRLGLIAVSSPTGLGYQTRSYYKHLKPIKTLVIDISMFNGMKQNQNWYPGAEYVYGMPNIIQLKNFLRGLDIVLTAETPYNFDLYKLSKDMGVKTVCVENPEFYDYFKYPNLPMPDLIILPSTWKETEIRAHAEPLNTKVIQLHHPVDRDEFTFKLRTTKKFIHIAGNPAVYDRNGTMDYLKADPRGIIITQNNQLALRIKSRYSSCRVIENIENPKDLYEFGDILVLPRRYGGNCLPLNEALSTGMPVIMPNISPNNDLLPKEWLVKAEKYTEFTPRSTVDVYAININDLQDKLNWFKSCDIQAESRKADKLADSISWNNLKNDWQEALKSIL